LTIKDTMEAKMYSGSPGEKVGDGCFCVWGRQIWFPTYSIDRWRPELSKLNNSFLKGHTKQVAMLY
jgi:hypothetical protein